MRGDSRIVLLVAATTVLGGGCGMDRRTATTMPVRPEIGVEGEKGVPALSLDPKDYVPEVDNPYLGFARGKVFRYASETPDGLETVVVEVTNETKTILGIATTVVHDRVYLNGDLVEDTFDWYAQDQSGNVWYFGEDSKEIANGEVVSTHGSWEAGVDGATPGIIMLAEPRPGMHYAQEFAPGVAEDQAKVVSVAKPVELRNRTFEECLKTKEWTPLERGIHEFKFYAPGVGLVMVSGSGGEVTELTAVEP